MLFCSALTTEQPLAVTASIHNFPQERRLIGFTAV